jgi:hypothetical protein
MKKKLNFGSLAFNMVVALFIAVLVGAPAVFAAGASLVAGTVLSFTGNSPVLMSGLQKEIWTDIIMEGFYPENTFLNEARDMSYLVDFNTINLAEAGSTPTAVLDTTFSTGVPSAPAARTDAALSVALRTIDTTTTVVRNIEEMEAAYDKMASVVYGHKQEILRMATKLAAWNFAPASDATNTPVAACTGATNGNSGRKMTFADVLALKLKFDQLDVPQEGRILVLNPYHEANLIEADIAMYRGVLQSNMLFGFKLYRTSITPYYISTTGVKTAWAATPVSGTDVVSSFAFHKDEVMKAIGSVDVFARYKDPEWKGDLINFQMRFLAKSLRSKYYAAIYSKIT